MGTRLDRVSARLDTVSARLDSIQRNVGSVGRGVSQLRMAAEGDGGFGLGLLLFLSGAAAGGLALRLVTVWRSLRHTPPPATPPNQRTPVNLDAPERTSHGAAGREPRRTDMEWGRQTGSGLAVPTARMEALLRDGLRPLEDQIGALRRELYQAVLREQRWETRPPHAGAATVAAQPQREGDFVTRESELRDLSGSESRGGQEERLQVVLNEEGIFVPYPEKVSTPMAEIRWRRGEDEAEGIILTGFLFGLDSRRLQIAFDVDVIDDGRYETVRPARVDWSEGRGRGRVLGRGQLRYVGT